MAHAHTHHEVIHDYAHAQYTMRAYQSYRWLFAIGLVGATVEFLVALLLTHSVSAQSDAIHAFTHLSLYALACLVSRQIVIHHMDAHRAYHYHEQFLKYYAFFVFAGLAWICYMSIMKFVSGEAVINRYMLESVSIGLCANAISIMILGNISKNRPKTLHTHKAHKLFILDAKGDFAISLIVLITSLLFTLFPSLPMHIIDPTISLGAVGWIGYSGVQIIKGA